MSELKKRDKKEVDKVLAETPQAQEEEKKEEYFSRTKFQDMDYICDKTKKALTELKYETATEIQEKAIPVIRAGKNL